MPFLRADPQAPAGVLVTLGTFPDEEAMRSFLAALAGTEWAAARRALTDLFRAARRAPVEFQFRYDWDGLIVRGRFQARSPADADGALRALRDLADQICADRRAGTLPRGATVVTATFDRGWHRYEAYGYDPARGSPVRMVWRGAWEPAGGDPDP